MEIKNIIEYWIKSSEEDYITAQALFSTGRYAHSLFFCHLTLEKVLKGLVVKKINNHAPYEHNLLELSELTGIEFSQEQRDLMNEINTFNIKGRYDDYKFKFHKKATKQYAEKYIKETKELYLWLKEQLTK